MTNISNFLADWHLEGLAVGLATFLIIGLFHPVVIKCEYYFGVRCWWWFLVLQHNRLHARGRGGILVVLDHQGGFRAAGTRPQRVVSSQSA